jgi:hypothetical protein
MRLKNYLASNRFNQFYYVERKRSLENNKNVDLLEKEKRKYNFQHYSNERFFKKFGIEIYNFLAKLKELDKNSEEYQKLIDITKGVSSGNGRRIKKMKTKTIIKN